MDITSSAATVGMFGALMGLIEIIKMLVAKRNGKKHNTPACQRVFPDEPRQELKSIYKLLHQFDKDGAPLCFFPRSWGEVLDEQTKIIQKLVITQEQQTRILEKMADKIP